MDHAMLQTATNGAHPHAPRRFIEHGTQADQLEEAGLTAWHVAHTALSLLGRKKDVAAIMRSHGVPAA